MNSGGIGKGLGDALQEVPLDPDVLKESLRQSDFGKSLLFPKESGNEDKEPEKEHWVV